MGMFDYVYYRCPKCKEVVEEQSKAGSCSLIRYYLGDIAYELPEFKDEYGNAEPVIPAPPEIVAEASKFGLVCSKCGHKIIPVMTFTYVFKPWKEV
jgi:DNA-directed RNA polymerase subunit RPC12/RpoP